MVLKFDHISYSCDESFDYRSVIPEEYEEQFVERNLQNIRCKEKFLQYGSGMHNIFMLDSKENNIPIEITQYPMVSGANSNLILDKSKIYWYVKELEEAVKFFSILGMKVIARDENSVELSITPFLDKKEYVIHFLRESKKETVPYLDVQGFSSVGLLVDSAEKNLKKISQKGFYVTEISKLKVNGKWLDIGFAEGKNGEIVELISLLKSKEV